MNGAAPLSRLDAILCLSQQRSTLCVRDSSTLRLQRKSSVSILIGQRKLGVLVCVIICGDIGVGPSYLLIILVS